MGSSDTLTVDARCTIWNSRQRHHAPQKRSSGRSSEVRGTQFGTEKFALPVPRFALGFGAGGRQHVTKYREDTVKEGIRTVPARSPSKKIPVEWRLVRSSTCLRHEEFIYYADW